MNLPSEPAISGPALEPRRTLGILGGLGPHAHVLLEHYLLEAARRWAGAVRDQDFPGWILSSIPQTPDRTAALDPGGPDVLTPLIESLRSVEPAFDASGRRIRGADLVLIACNTAHAFLDDLRASTSLPILDMIEACSVEVARQAGAGARVGLLATTGTLSSGLYHRSLTRHGLVAVSLLDAVGGETLQSDLVMDPVYGRPGIFEGLKTRGPAASREAVDRPREHLLEACRRLRDELRCEVLIAACTEIPLALPGDHVEGLPLVDSLRILARDAILRVYDLDPNPVS